MSYFLCIDVEIEISVLKCILHDTKSAYFRADANDAPTQQMTTTNYKWESGIIYGKSKEREVKELPNTK